ncbi:folylpolyglutamate synthase/dihydrofolate synthase family protein [Palleronia sp. LCG004]|uniref:bifunctional folylpolyglutamate synthase/dihydrofolate synthase n=1 Tax=Palleronia sp. LCG004 TaxID=3079304 RepID=UPI002943B2F8|nr:folylpolyglutamate synthase/dihydrofolate synthase family protein [Palleronia sp. LCG004]WOI56051.1 folylpolyglutamate synthase/dihydrofolate synthase family protein [Palleronia sp. LCG004]
MGATRDSDIILERLSTLHPKIIDLSLDRMHRLLDRLGNPERNLPPVIHIAGTNGKGSTLAMIRAGLEAAGKTCHAYTSPHLARFHERIRVAGELISEPDLAALLDECEDANDGAPITFFEVTTCAAILAFARHHADYTLLEVGLGGRLDATNVVAHPALSIITPVALDHQSYLGDTIAAIAGEKAGILKRTTPAVIARQSDAALEVIEARAARLGAPLSTYGQDWHVWSERDRLVFQDERGLLDLPLPVLQGPHQIDNAGTAIAALRLIGLGEDAIARAMREAVWPARMQRLKHGPCIDAAPEAEILLDGGHNPAAGEAIAATLAAMPARETHLVCGMLNTKDVAGYLAPLAPHVTSLTALSIPGEANTLPADRTADAARIVGIEAHTAESDRAACAAIAARAPHARILVCGSLYLAGRILQDHS